MKGNKIHAITTIDIPRTVKVEGLLLDTVHVYTPPSPPVTVRVWVYCAVTGSSNTVSFPSVIVVLSLVQITVVAGPPIEIQVSVYRGIGRFSSESTVILLGIVMFPLKQKV